MFKKGIWSLFLFCCTNVMAQQKSGVFGQWLMPGPDGVYILIADKSNSGHVPLDKTYIISKDEKGKGSFKKIAELKFPSSATELAERLQPRMLDEILQNTKLSSAEDLYHQITSGHIDRLGLYLMDPQVMMALGVLFVDKAENRHKDAGYRVEYEKDGMRHLLFEKYLKDVVYSSFPKFRRYEMHATDSAVSCTWYTAGGRAPLAHVFQSDGRSNTSRQQLVYEVRDTLFISYTGAATPGSHYMLYAQPSDYAGNTGSPSDTIRMIASAMDDAIGIQHLTVTDTLNGMLLQWDPLPDKNWIAGIQVWKSHAALDHFLVVDTLPAHTTSWLDRNVIGGTVYYYRLLPVMYNLPNPPAAAMALTHGEKKIVSEKMPAPQGLKVSLDSARNIRLSWKPDAVLNLFGYYILRGRSATDLEVISDPVADTVYIDSLKNLSPGSHYFYAIAARDMNLAWSDTSEVIVIDCPVNKLVTAPAGLSARYTEYGVRLFWNDVSLTDENVAGYIVYKRKKGEAFFKPLMQHPWPDHVFTDTLIADAGDYEYGCAAMDARGNQSVLSSLADVSVPGITFLYPPATFDLKNIAAGISISVPSFVGAGDDRSLVIYRRAASEKKMKKLGTLSDGGSSFVDKSVRQGVLYVYVVSQLQSGAESAMSKEKAIRR